MQGKLSDAWKRIFAAVNNTMQNHRIGEGRIGMAGVTIIIPVFNAPCEFDCCVKSVLKHTRFENVRLLIINDGSSDEAITPLLQEYAGIEGLEILHNKENIGYTRTINKGILHANNDDVVLLNSDTEVTPNWLEGLRTVAFKYKKVGTVTAMSNNAGSFSFPETGLKNKIPRNYTKDDFAIRIIQATKYCDPVEVPTGSGFCMYIARKLINEIGLFDHEAFPRGYGEENDFCMRASRAGWGNYISPWSYVYHVRSASFKNEKEKLMKTAVDIMVKRYPDYLSSVNAAFTSKKMQKLKAASRKAYDL